MILENLYHAGYTYGWITIKEAEALIAPNRKYGTKGLTKEIGRSLEALEVFIAIRQKDFEGAGTGDLFPKSPTSTST
jgi:hypothetical protein